MKHFIFSLGFMMLFSTASYSKASEKPDSGVVLENQFQEKQSDLNQDHYICLGDGWKSVNLLVHNKIRDIKIVDPDVFKDISDEKKNCFSPVEVPGGLRKEIDEILYRIDLGAADKFHVTVGAKGEIVPTNDLVELPKTKPTAFEPNIPSAPRRQVSLRNEERSFLTKLGRAELFIGGAEIIKFGTLIALPKSVTNWSENWHQDATKNLKRAWTTAPVIDKDGWVINYVGHPYTGALYYNAVRSQGATRLQSFLLSSVQSALWEYSIEALAEQPSIQDLIITPIIGSVVGELAHQGTLRMARNGFSFGEKVLVTIINPSYILNNGYRVKFKN